MKVWCLIASVLLFVVLTASGCGGLGGQSKGSIFDDSSTVNSPSGSVASTAKAYSPDGLSYAMQIAPVSLGAIGVYNRQSNDLKFTVQTLSAGTNNLKGMAWDRTSQYLAVMYHGGSDPGITLYRVSTGAKIAVIGPEGTGGSYFHYIVFSSDNTQVVASPNGTSLTKYPSCVP